MAPHLLASALPFAKKHGMALLGSAIGGWAASKHQPNAAPRQHNHNHARRTGGGGFLNRFFGKKNNNSNRRHNSGMNPGQQIHIHLNNRRRNSGGNYPTPQQQNRSLNQATHQLRNSDPYYYNRK